MKLLLCLSVLISIIASILIVSTFMAEKYFLTFVNVVNLSIGAVLFIGVFREIRRGKEC